MKEFHQRHGLSIQNISFSAPSKRAKLAYAVLFISPFSNSLSLSPPLFCFSPKDIRNDWRSRVTSLYFSYLLIFPSKSKVCCITAANIRQALLWNCSDLGQRLISLSLWTNPGLRACILLAFRHLWFNITSPDMTTHHRQRLCDISLVPCDKEMVVFSSTAHQSYMNN